MAFLFEILLTSFDIIIFYVNFIILAFVFLVVFVGKFIIAFPSFVELILFFFRIPSVS